MSDADVQRLAKESGERVLIVLDALAAEPLRPWTNKAFSEQGLTDYAFAAIGGLSTKVRWSFHRSNTPVHYETSSGVWHWSVSSDLAEQWRDARRQD